MKIVLIFCLLLIAVPCFAIGPNQIVTGTDVMLYEVLHNNAGEINQTFPVSANYNCGWDSVYTVPIATTRIHIPISKLSAGRTAGGTPKMGTNWLLRSLGIYSDGAVYIVYYGSGISRRGSAAIDSLPNSYLPAVSSTLWEWTQLDSIDVYDAGVTTTGYKLSVYLRAWKP
jgi:hypothetical protein